jgi:hypothetical protein
VLAGAESVVALLQWSRTGDQPWGCVPGLKRAQAFEIKFRRPIEAVEAVLLVVALGEPGVASWDRGYWPEGLQVKPYAQLIGTLERSYTPCDVRYSVWQSGT